MSDPIILPLETPEPITDTAYNESIAKGARLLRMLESNDHDAGQLMNPARPTAQSEFTSRQALANYGYTDVSWPSVLDRKALQSLRAALEGIGVNTELVCDGGTNVVIVHRHEHGIEYLNDAASFQQICNPDQGVLIASVNTSASAIARSCPELTIPSLHHWSDVAYMQWLEACDQTASEPDSIRYVFRLRVMNPTTTAVVQRVMANRGHGTFTSYPGETFDIDSEEGKAILGTPNGVGVAWLLIQRKRELGHETIKDVTVFWAEYEGKSPGDYPSLLFRID
ncbi:hypothetical protein HBI38_094300 [Parastagonospora nodorum]|nr:hypothetical protein HBI10_127490 [Parastagonospora nodorum]KAH4024025.1 hypothetical protein HBI13_082050 [Parastagonospora nodorum]KAH4854165.1 hypothetical protein HBH75_097840 [Parastagonospora nodorum]KAH4938166.1 hypothetical protein HBH73_165800 [Parastagonospora nodorum]KAH4943908.1 hypothetical protein HBH74_056540 [Parastagonospora nodorum]